MIMMMRSSEEPIAAKSGLATVRRGLQNRISSLTACHGVSVIGYFITFVTPRWCCVLSSAPSG